MEVYDIFLFCKTICRKIILTLTVVEKGKGNLRMANAKKYDYSQLDYKQ